jgi:lipoprotein NlpI
MIAEEREALRLNPNNDKAHASLGLALGKKGDWGGAIAQFREALRLNPSYDLAHFGLRLALEKKANLREAFEEFRAAYTIDPKDPFYKLNYERLLQPVNQ